MAIRIPLKTILSSDNAGEVGAGSVGGGVAIPFTIPQDTNNILVKIQASTVGGGVSAQLQTTDDGGTTWYGIARTSIVSNAIGDNAAWLSAPVDGVGVKPNAVTGSVLGTTSSAQPSTLGSQQWTGLPILSQKARILLQLTAAVSASSVLLTEVKVNDQSATA